MVVDSFRHKDALQYLGHAFLCIRLCEERVLQQLVCCWPLVRIVGEAFVHEVFEVF